MTRADATNYLTQLVGSLATEAELTSQQATDAYTQAIDNSWRQQGVSETNLSTAVLADNQILPTQALLLYYALKQFSVLFASRMDVTIAGNVQAKRSQQYLQVQHLLHAAMEECAGYGFYVGGPSFQMGRMTLDYLEPTGSGL